jgi:hypothetical protein
MAGNVEDLHAGRLFASFYAAKQYLSESFFQMYLEHTCQGQCGSPHFRGEPDIRNWASLSWNAVTLGSFSYNRLLQDLA